MKIAIFGVGHVGLPTALTLARIGHEVWAVDHDSDKVRLLNEGRVPFFEPGLQELMDEVVATGRVRFVEGASEAVPGAEVAMICVGTPARPGGDANLLAVERAAEAIGKFATSEAVVAQKSTVPVETAERLERTVLRRSAKHRFHLVSNPEFLREGNAVKDSLEPERILVGADSEYGHEVMRRLYEPLITDEVIYHATDIRTAELAKHACNAFLALKVSYANALARICEAAGADVVTVADIMGADPRIGREFLNAGLGFGGYCFPKDLAAFRFVASRFGYEFGLLDEVVKINSEAVEATFSKVKDALWNLEDKRVALFGLAFKPNTDDIREAPALKLARMLIKAGVTVVGHDPQANEAAKHEVPELEIFDDPYEAADGADCIVICTEWSQFQDLDLARLKGILTRPVVVDARNVFDPGEMEEAGFTYLPTGRRPINL